jgi:GT2 family glycosyltransferase
MTVACVDSVITRTPGHDYEIIVVDNGSDAHISHALAALLPSDERVHLLRSSDNRNFAGGSNMGALAARGTYLVFLNNDTEVMNDAWLEPLLAPLTDPHVLGTQGLLVYPDGSIQTAGTVFLGDGLLPCHLLAGEQVPAEGLAVLDQWHFTAVTAACLAVRACDFHAVRGFDVGYQNGFEDVDLCMRLIGQAPEGGDFHLASRSRVTHFESRSRGRFDHVDQNRQRFSSRWRDRLDSADEGIFRLTDYELVAVLSDGLDVPAAKPTLRRRSADGQGPGQGHSGA